MPVPRELPWPMPKKSLCQFYHSMDFPDGDCVAGVWDLRGRFEEYIGGYPIKGKTVLDVGTASGFLAFEAERAGATVTATDLRHISEITLLPYHEQPYQSGDLRSWEAAVVEDWKSIKSAFWYSWHKFNSKVSMVYSPLRDLRYWDDRFDVVTAGAILEHLSDPVTAIGVFTRMAKESVVIPFTPVVNTKEMVMRPMTDLANPDNYFTWWELSAGLYERVFAIAGFNVEFTECSAYEVAARQEVKRPTIIARRR